jgi:peptide/nickel transport system substrate-binding protein
VKGKSIQYIAINNTNPCFDLNFRKALNLAIDKGKLIDKILDSQAAISYTSIPKEYFPTNTVARPENFYYEFNPALAKDFLKASRCFPAILNTELDFRMRGDDENKAKGAAIAQYLKDIGLQVKVSPMEKIKLYKENSEKKGDLTLLTWYLDYDSVNNFIDPLFSNENMGNAGNRAFYSNSIVQAYIGKLKKEEVVSERELEKVIQTLYEEAPWIFLWSVHENYVLSPKALRFPVLLNYL